MKTTLVLDDALVERVREIARARGVSMSSVVEEAIVLLMANRGCAQAVPPPLPSFHGGGYLVDITDRDALYDAMDDL